jgi:hypothetical protein
MEMTMIWRSFHQCAQNPRKIGLKIEILTNFQDTDRSSFVMPPHENKGLQEKFQNDVNNISDTGISGTKHLKRLGQTIKRKKIIKRNRHDTDLMLECHYT